MTVIAANVIIGAIDNASGVFARVGASAAASAKKITSSFKMLGGMASLATFGLGSSVLKQQAEVDRLLRLMQSAGEMSNLQRMSLSRTAHEAALMSGVGVAEIIKGQQALIQGGLDVTTTESMTAMFARVARANGISMEKVAEDGINVANSMGWAMGTVEEKMASLKRAMEFMSVVPNLSTESWEGLRTSLKYAAPIAGALKIDVEELGAALSILADAGFKAEEGGTAFRTIMTRAQAPTRAARMEMRALGIQLEDLYRFDPAKLHNMVSLRERLLASGLGSRGGRGLDLALKKFTDPSKFKNAYDMGDAMMDSLASSLGIKKGDADKRSILKKVIDGHIRMASGGFDLATYFRGIGKMEVPQLKEMFGLQRLPQAMKLRDGINQILNSSLPKDQQITKFKDLARRFKELMSGSIDRRFSPVGEGLAFELDRMGTAWSNLQNAFMNAGSAGIVGSSLRTLSNAMASLSRADPNALNMVAAGLAAIVVIPAAGLTLAAVATGLRGISGAVAALGGALGGGIVGRLIAGGGIYGLLMGDWKELFEGGQFTVGDPDSWVADSPISRMMQSFRELSSSFGGLGTELSPLADIIKEFTQIGSLNPLVIAVDGVATAARLAGGAVKSLADYIKVLKGEMKLGGDDPADSFWTVEKRVRPGSLLDRMLKSDFWRAGSERLREIEEEDKRKLLPPSRDYSGDMGAATVRVDGEARVETILRVEPSPEFRVLIDEARKMISVPLATGRSMPDTAPGTPPVGAVLP